jgi:hypothetical protein
MQPDGAGTIGKIRPVAGVEVAEIAQLVGGFSKFAARGAARRESDQ